jgi:PhnB protein
MATINPYLTFNGNCEEAFNFYKSVFGTEFKDFNRFKDFEQGDGPKIPEKDLNKLMHVSLPISKETILMGSDAHPLYPPISVGQHLSIAVTAESKAEADKLFKGLTTGGKITMPIDKTFWGAYFGMLVDKYGIIWMVSYDERPPNK